MRTLITHESQQTSTIFRRSIAFSPANLETFDDFGGYFSRSANMLKLLLLAVVAAGCSAVIFDKQLDADWQEWKEAYNKVYSAEDELVRRLIWEENLKMVTHHNLEESLGKQTYTLAMNKFADLTNSEFRKMMNGYRQPPKPEMGPQCSTFLPPSYIQLPDTVDWRTKGYVTPVKDQGQCGSCWAFSATGSLEGQHFKKSGTLVSLSEQDLVDCSRPEGNAGCNGGWMNAAFDYVKKNHGIDTEKCYPYVARKHFRCEYKKSCVGATDTGCMDVLPHKNETSLQEAVATVGPVSVAIDASHMSFQLYHSGVYNEPHCSSTLLDHGVLAVGYGTKDPVDYWLVKNSWNTDWGMQGYIKMSRNKDNQCGIATQASYPKV